MTDCQHLDAVIVAHPLDPTERYALLTVECPLRTIGPGCPQLRPRPARLPPERRMRRDRDGSVIGDNLDATGEGCDDGWLGETTNGGRIPGLTCRPHLIPTRTGYIVRPAQATMSARRNAGRAKRPGMDGWEGLSYDPLTACIDARHYASLDRWEEATVAAHRAGTLVALLAAALDDDVRNTAPLLAAARDDGYGL